MTEPTLPPIDPTTYASLEEVAGGDIEFMAELLGQYLQDAVVLVEAFAPALAWGDARALERATHTLKSSSANVGALTLSNQCDELQTIARSDELGDAREKAVRAEAEFARVRVELTSRLEKYKAQI